MFAVIYIPHFSLQAVVRHEPELQEAAVALVEEESAKARVAQASELAVKFGVVPGISSTQAKARCPQIKFRLCSSAQEEAAQEVLLECAYFSAAFIESTGPGICTSDLRGLPVLKANPLEPALAAWADHGIDRLRQFGIAAQLGIAASPALAMQAAHTAPRFRFVHDAEAFWKTLPVQALSAGPELQEVLGKWGIRTVGEFVALGKSRIAERLGSAGVALFERANSDEVRPLRLTSPRAVYEELYEFEQRVETLEPLLFIVRRLLTQLTQRLELVARSVAELELKLRLESNEVHQSIIKIASPSRDVNVLFRITHNYLENVRTASPIMAVSLRATPRELQTQQFQLFESSVRDPNRFYETISRLGALLGPERVGTPKLRDSFGPEDFEMTRPSASPGPPKAPSGTLLDADPKPRRARGLPLRRFRPPVSARVRLKNGAPFYVQCAVLDGAVARSAGPWRSSGDWWENLWAREEWDIEMKSGGVYRVFLENHQWFLEGAYD